MFNKENLDLITIRALEVITYEDSTRNRDIGITDNIIGYLKLKNMHTNPQYRETIRKLKSFALQNKLRAIEPLEREKGTILLNNAIGMVNIKLKRIREEIKGFRHQVINQGLIEQEEKIVFTEIK